MKNYKIITLGPSGSGKTVFLSSMFKQLSTQGDYGFFLEVENTQQRQLLNTHYGEIITGEEWPAGTRGINELTFTCCVKTKDLSTYRACKFIYKDYAGSAVTEQEEQGILFDIQSEVDQADVVLAILDGQKILNLLQGTDQTAVNRWLLKDLTTMLQLIQRCKTIPVHFIVSKWDLIENVGSFDLSDVRHKLNKLEEFKNVVKQRNDAKCPLRLIPVSSVGMDFAVLYDGIVRKKAGAIPRPYQVEVPLACVLIDGLTVELNQAREHRKKVDEQSTKVSPKFGFLDQVNQLLANTVLDPTAKVGRALLPDKYKFNNEIMQKLIDAMGQTVSAAEEKAKRTKQEVIKVKAAAAIESERLRLQKEESLKKVNSEETALNHIVERFISIQQKLDRDYPESNLGGSGV
jgi:GTPase SAR1 family protein